MAQEDQEPKADEPQASITRRRFIQGVMAASAAAAAATLSAKAIAGGLVGVGAGAVESFPGLSEGQRHTLATVLDRIIPAQGVMPGAGGVGVGAFIEHV